MSQEYFELAAEVRGGNILVPQNTPMDLHAQYFTDRRRTLTGCSGREYKFNSGNISPLVTLLSVAALMARSVITKQELCEKNKKTKLM